MDTCTLKSVEETRSLVALAQSSDEPVVVFDEWDECLVAMRPTVFERILFDSHLLNAVDRSTLRL